MYPPKGEDEYQSESKGKWLLLVLVPVGVLIYGSHSVLLNLSKVDGTVPFNSASCVLMIEIFKLLISFLLLWKESAIDRKVHRLPSFQQTLLFSVPALLYCLNNNFVVHIQLYMDPASFQVLSNLKTVSTALLYRLMIRRRMTSRQWLAISLLVLAGISNSYGGLHSQEHTMSNMQIQVNGRGLALMSIYCFISGLAGVYTEYILKKHREVSLSLQNVFLYMYGVTFNLLAFLWMSGFQPSVFFQGYSVWTAIIIISQAVNGLIMSAIFKHGSNIIRLFIISSAMVVTTVLSMLLFSLQLNLYFYYAFALVVISLFLYHKK